ncbi:hypothetical protein RB594_007178 [Gaeumannomyces avenae]
MATTLNDLINQSEPHRHFSNRPRAGSDPIDTLHPNSAGGWFEKVPLRCPEAPEEASQRLGSLLSSAVEPELLTSQESSHQGSGVGTSIDRWLTGVEVQPLCPIRVGSMVQHTPATVLEDQSMREISEQRATSESAFGMKSSQERNVAPRRPSPATAASRIPEPRRHRHVQGHQHAQDHYRFPYLDHHQHSGFYQDASSHMPQATQRSLQTA